MKLSFPPVPTTTIRRAAESEAWRTGAHARTSTGSGAPPTPVTVAAPIGPPAPMMGRSRRTLVLACAGAVVLAAVITWAVLPSPIRCYGIVSAGVDVFHAPVRSRVVDLCVQPGDRVTADSVLCVLASDDAQVELREAEESLAQGQAILADLERPQPAGFDDPVQQLRDLQAGEARVTSRDAELQTVRDRASEASALRTNALTEASAAADRQTRLLAIAREHAQAIHELRAADAAVPAEVQQADHQVDDAAFALAQASTRLAQLRAEDAAASDREGAEQTAAAQASAGAHQDLAALKAVYAQAIHDLQEGRRRAIENRRSRIATLEAKVAHLKRLAGPTPVRALSDGVITECFVTSGSTVPKDGDLMSVSGTGKLWIQAFVPPERAHAIHRGQSAMIYPTTGQQALHGKVTADGGIQHRVPPSLQSLVSEQGQVYLRVDLDDPHPDLIPGNVVRLAIRR